MLHSVFPTSSLEVTMRRALLSLAALCCISLSSLGQIFGPEGMNMPGDFNGFTNPPNKPAFAGITGGGTFLLNSDLPTPRYRTLINIQAAGGDTSAGTYNWLFTSGPVPGNPYANKWAGVGVIIDTVQDYSFNFGPDNAVTLANGKHYTVNFWDNGYNPSKAIWMATTGVPVNFLSVTQTPVSGSVTDTDTVEVSVVVDGPLSPEEIVYLRYTTDNWATSSLQGITIASQAGSAAILPQVGGTTVEYYVFTTTKSNPTTHFDLYTLNHDNNGGVNYSYTIPAPVYTIIATSGPGGSITPADTVYVNAGDDTTFTIVGNVGYIGDQLIIDGVPGPHTALYTFTNVQQNHTIHPTFKAAVQFRVNMKVAMLAGIFDPGLGDVVTIPGSFNGWNTSAEQMSDGDNDSIYTKEVYLSLSQNYSYKFFKTLRGGQDYEGGGNRTYSMGTTPDVLPVVYYNNQGPTISVTFQVDMSVKMQEGLFDPGTEAVTVRGSFNDWGNSTNNPDTLTDGDNDSVYTKSISMASTQTIGYKFWASVLDYEAGSDRSATLSEQDTTLPTVFFSNDNIVGPPGFIANPTSLSFGSVDVGDPVMDSIVVTNDGIIQTEIVALSLVGSGDFSFAPSAPISIPPSGNATFYITFAPTSAGAHAANLIFTSNAPSSEDTIPLSGTGEAVGPSPKFLTISPETLIAKDPVKGKLLKAVKRAKAGKPITMPNWANLIDETIAQGGFQPGASESDSAGGLLIGVSFMERKNPGDPAKPNWKPIKDSAAVHGWVRVGKWNFKKSVGASPTAIPKTLENKTITHMNDPNNVPRGFDSTAYPGAPKRKLFVKEVKKLDPKKTPNALFAELVTLKVNIATSQLGKTPAGFGDLIFDVDTSAFDEMSVMAISEKADSMMTYWSGHSNGDFADLFNATYAINRAFIGALDTFSFIAGDSAFPLGKLVLKGQVELSSVPYLKEPVPFVPTTIAATTYEVESLEDDFEDEEFEEGVPVAAKLYQNYPNPFNPTTNIAFRLLETSSVTIKIYNMLGQEVATLLNGEEFDEGLQTLEFAPSGLASGVYFYQVNVQGLEDAGFRTLETRKMVLLK